MKYYTFQLYVGGFGNTPDEAWEDCIESEQFNEYAQHEYSRPDSYTVEEVDDDD